NEEAIASYDKALEINPNNEWTWKSKGFTLKELGKYSEAIICFDKAIQIKPDYDLAWCHRGYAFLRLENFEDAWESFEKEQEFDEGSAQYDKACFFAVQNQPRLTIKHLKKAISIDSKKYLERAKTDSDFDSIRDSLRFQTLIQEK
ncbi:MAG: tetratricopeptide repeat protein, partial [Limnothrix sp.]